jgi:glutamate dehydrogenase
VKETPYNAFYIAQEQFDRAAEVLELSQAVRDLLRTPIREYHFSIPVRMDNGEVRIFRGFRVQQMMLVDQAEEASAFIPRKRLIWSVLWQCGTPGSAPW